MLQIKCLSKCPYFQKPLLPWKIPGYAPIMVPFILPWGLQLYLKKGLWHRCFPVRFVKFLRTTFYRTLLGGCFCVSKLSPVIKLLAMSKKKPKNKSNIGGHFVWNYPSINNEELRQTVRDKISKWKIQCVFDFLQGVLSGP